MSKKILSLSIIAAAIVSSNVNAHEIWVEVLKGKAGAPLVADLAYGHFPSYEKIPESRTHFFKPMTLISSKDVETLKLLGTTNYTYTSSGKLEKGSYIVTAEYTPQFWTKDNQGKWHNKDKTQVEDPNYCVISSMYAKEILNVGGKSNLEVISKTVGHKLEIIPAFDPSQAKLNKAYEVHVLLDGKPLPHADVYATFNGFGDIKLDVAKHEALPDAFHAKTDDAGTFKFIPLKDGKWVIYVKIKDIPTQGEDAHKCETSSQYATLALTINK